MVNHHTYNVHGDFEIFIRYQDKTLLLCGKVTNLIATVFKNLVGKILYYISVWVHTKIYQPNSRDGSLQFLVVCSLQKLAQAIYRDFIRSKN